MLVTKYSHLSGFALRVHISAKVACVRGFGDVVKSFLFRLAVTQYEVLKEGR
jgi:hypothetical protein